MSKFESDYKFCDNNSGICDRLGGTSKSQETFDDSSCSDASFKGCNRDLNSENIVYQTIEQCGVTLTVSKFGSIVNPQTKINETVRRFSWTTINNLTVAIITYGARVVSLKVPDYKNEAEEISLAFSSIEDYDRCRCFYFGALIGRTVGGLKNADYCYRLKEENSNQEFGIGLDEINWNYHLNNTELVLTHLSPHNSNGYSGDLYIELKYNVSNNNTFTIEMQAKTSMITPVNLTQRLYLNLAGYNKGPIELEKHVVFVNSDFYGKDGKHINNEVGGTIYDIRTPVEIDTILFNNLQQNQQDSFSTYFKINLDESEPTTFVTRVIHPGSGRAMELYTNQPIVYFSTCANLPAIKQDDVESFIGEESKFECEVAGMFENVVELRPNIDEIISTTNSQLDTEDTFKFQTEVYKTKPSSIAHVCPYCLMKLEPERERYNKAQLTEIKAINLHEDRNDYNVLITIEENGKETSMLEQDETKLLQGSTDKLRRDTIQIEPEIYSSQSYKNNLLYRCPSAIRKDVTHSMADLDTIKSNSTAQSSEKDVLLYQCIPLTKLTSSTSSIREDISQSNLNIASKSNGQSGETNSLKLSAEVDIKSNTNDQSCKRHVFQRCVPCVNLYSGTLGSGECVSQSNADIESNSNAKVSEVKTKTNQSLSGASLILGKASGEFSELLDFDTAVHDLAPTSIIGPDNSQYSKNCGFYFQTQNVPCSSIRANERHHLSEIMLKPGEVYQHRIGYKFGLFVKIEDQDEGDSILKTENVGDGIDCFFKEDNLKDLFISSNC